MHIYLRDLPIPACKRKKGDNIVKSKATTRFLAALMALTMLLSCSALAADIKVDAAADTSCSPLYRCGDRTTYQSQQDW